MKVIPKNPGASRLCKKLSALRTTLPNDEREILDDLVAANKVTGLAKATAKPFTEATSGKSALTKAARNIG